MDTSLDHLDPRFRVRVFELLARLVEKRVPLVVINTLRTQAEQDAAIARGVSWVSHSKHQDGLAIDVCPVATYVVHQEQKLDWDATDPVWTVLGLTGESLGLIWGGRWTVKDLGHFEQGS